MNDHQQRCHSCANDPVLMQYHDTEWGHNPGIVRHQKKIEATIKNASIFQTIIQKEGSFSPFLKRLPPAKEDKEKVLSEVFYHVGATTAESFLFATGVIPPPHDEHCFLNAKD